MRFSTGALLLVVALVAGLDHSAQVSAKKPSRPSPASRRSSGRGGPSGSSSSSRRPPVSKRRYESYDDEEEDDELGYNDDPYDDEEDEEIEVDIEVEFEEDDEEEEDYRPKPRKSKSSGGRRPPPSKKRAPPRSSRYSDEEDDYDPPRRPRKGPPPRSGRGRGPPPRRGGRGRVVPYTQQQPSSFTRGLDALRSSMPDPGSVKDAAMKSLNVARETTSSLSSNLYREVKGLTSSELEQVMLKATRPDDTPVKGKHAERLVGVTYQVSGRYDIYDAVLRKLWAKMTEKDWRTTIKALYILHRFSADGSPDHANALKSKVREMRRTRDPKRKEKYFASKLLSAGDNSPASLKYREFMMRYAHYVLIRTQCFAGLFDEIARTPAPEKKKKKAGPKPITSTSLRKENLDAARLVLENGIKCTLKNGEECENTALAVERVVSDLIGLSAAVATALNKVLKGSDLHGADPALIKQWCEFYSEELAPQTRAMVKKTAPKLDAFQLYLPSRTSVTVSPDLIQKGLKLDEAEGASGDEGGDDAEEEEESKEGGGDSPEGTKDAAADEPKKEEAGAGEEEDAVDDEEELDEYEYEEDEEYYDDEEDDA
ncbi:MAG: hypothetical protein SGILL_003663 [Bacillariaceae sp.]